MNIQTNLNVPLDVVHELPEKRKSRPGILIAIGLIAAVLVLFEGTAKAVVDLVEGLGGTIAGLVFVVELEFLPGRKNLEGYDVRSLIKYKS